MPDTGSMMALIKASTGKDPLIMGKPHSFTVEYLTNRFHCEKDELCFIGDRLETDILIGQKHSIPSVLVLTGVTDMDLYKQSAIRATAVEDSLKSFSMHI